MHILTVGGVISRVCKMEKKGRGKSRAWCNRCRQLKDNRRFHWCVWVPHPDSETGLYMADPWGEWICADCIKAKRKEWVMPKREYFRRLNRTIDIALAPTHEQTKEQHGSKADR